MREVIAAIREGLPSADQMQAGDVFRHVLNALRARDAKAIDDCTE
jgi:hypothetical protein